MSGQATISLTMIAKDAERSLAAALASVRPFVDQLVVVNTGSQDGTTSVAQQFGAQVFDFPWCDDFSAARNFAISRASGDWIFWLDADDVLPEASGLKLHTQVEATPSRDAAFFVLVEEQVQGAYGQQLMMAHAHVKLFPRDDRLRFRYRVHEQILPAVRDINLPVYQTKITVRHAHADRSPAAELARSQRNLRLALLDLADHPDDPFVRLSVGSSYLRTEGGASQALEFFEGCVTAFPDGSTIQLNTYRYLAQAHAATGNSEQERATYDRALQVFPRDLGIRLQLAAWHESRGEWVAAIQHYELALAHGKHRASAVHRRNSRVELVLRLGRLYLATGRPEAAKHLWMGFCSAHPAAAAVRHALQALQSQWSTIIA